MNFGEFERHVNQVIFVSATPGPYEMEHSAAIVEQVIRPTGLLDPTIEVKPSEGQIDDLLQQIKLRVDRRQRCLVTTLTKRMAEELADFLSEMGIRNHYLHSDIHTLERVEILRDLRLGVYDVVVGITSCGRAGPARSQPGGHFGCRQGGVPALHHLADSDHWPRRPPRRRPRHYVRRPGYRFHEVRYRRNQPAPGHPGHSQPGERH